jgi:prevent-host-death family protein
MAGPALRYPSIKTSTRPPVASDEKVAKMATFTAEAMKCMSAKDAKNSFGLLLDRARSEPVTIEKHGRAVVVVVSIEEFERLQTKRVGDASLQSKDEFELD